MGERLHGMQQATSVSLVSSLACLAAVLASGSQRYTAKRHMKAKLPRAKRTWDEPSAPGKGVACALQLTLTA